MKLRHIFFALVIACAVAVQDSWAAESKDATSKATNRYNVLFIALDDLRPELGCYGMSYAQSPNLDKLASQGTLFTNHFVQVPTCGASRYALLTGRSPCNSGVTRSNEAMYKGDSALSAQQLDGAQTLPELFRRSGYHTVLIGKISHTADGRVFAYNGEGDGRDEMPNAWDEKATPFGSWKRGWGIFFAYSGGRSREDGHGYLDLMDFTVEKDDELPDGLMANTAIEKLRESKDAKQPFFMGLGFFKPHLPFVAPKQDWEAMAKVDVPPPPHPEIPDTAYWHKSSEFYKYNTTMEKTHPLSTEDQIYARRAYLACVRYTDRQVGKVLNALDELGLAENTVVVAWGDHGWFLGDSAMWAKHSPHDRALRSTLMIRAPGRPAGIRSDAIVETLDLYPTLVDLCNPSFNKTQYPLDGTSLDPILNGAEPSENDYAISYWGNGITVRTKTHRLIITRNGNDVSNVELYNIEQSFDPVENIAAANPELVERLMALLPKM